MEAQLAVVVRKGRIELVRPMDPAAIDDHDDLFPDFAEGGHHLMPILASLLGIKVGHDFIKDFGGAVLDGPNDTEQHTAGDTAPGAMADPRLAFEGLLAFDLTLAQRTRREARTLRCAPPARPEHGKAPQDRFVFREQNDFATARLGLERSECERAVGEISRGGSQATGGAVVAYLFFLMCSGRSHGQVGAQSVGPTPWPVRGNSIGKRSNRAGEGPGRQDD